jgi:hypothetical protein
MPTKWYSENTYQGRRDRAENINTDAVVIDTSKYQGDDDDDDNSTEYEADYITERGRNKVYCKHCNFKLEKGVRRYYCKRCNVYFKIKSKSDNNKKNKKTRLDVPQDPTNKEHNIAYPPDPQEEYLDSHNKNKPSGFFADILSPTGRWLEITELAGTQKVQEGEEEHQGHILKRRVIVSK